MQAQLTPLEAQYMHTALDLLASQGQGQAQLAVPAGGQAVPEGPHDTRSGTPSQLCLAGSTASAVWCAWQAASRASCLQPRLLHRACLQQGVEVDLSSQLTLHARQHATEAPTSLAAA